ncbi:MAG: hypothetical protein AB7V42_12240 [Thermoleophilia bacterium]
MDDFDQVEQLTRRITAAVGRAALIGIPVWLALLLVYPLTGLGIMPCFFLATLTAAAIVFAAERLRSRERRAAQVAGPAGGTATARPRRQLTPLGAAALTLAVVVALIYVIFILRSA